MRINSLEILNFRNLENQKILFPEGKQVILFTGQNGQGKTSLLEAIYLASNACSFRTSKPRELVKWEKFEKYKSHFDLVVNAEFETKIGNRIVSYAVKNGKRVVFVDEKKVEKAGEFFGHFPSLCFSQNDLQIINGSPSFRRKFLDRVISSLDPYYVENLVTYQRAIKHRNSYILNYVKSKIRNKIDESIIPWNISLAKSGIYIANARKKLIEDIVSIFSENYREISGKSSDEENCYIKYQSSFVDIDKVLNEEEVLIKYGETLLGDIARGSTSFGIHKDEVIFSMNSEFKHEFRDIASQGQKRTLIFSLFVTVSELITRTINEAPIILLDDFDSELDLSRQKNLFSLLAKFKSQIIVTSTDKTSVEEGFSDSKSEMRVEYGAVSQD